MAVIYGRYFIRNWSENLKQIFKVFPTLNNKKSI